MFARSTTVHAHLESLDAGIGHVQDEIMPTMSGMDGCVGVSMLVDRDSGQCITTSAWDSRALMRASEAPLRMDRDHLAEVLGGQVQVDEWEIAVLRRDHASAEGACVRTTWFRVPPERFDRGIDVYRLALLPEIEDMDGFCSASLFTDRDSGIAVSSVTFDTRAAMARTRGHADSLRTSGAREAGVEVLDIGEFELALAHLRVPEMA